MGADYRGAEKLWLTLREASQLYGIPEVKLHKAWKTKQLNVYKFGRHYNVQRRELEKYLEKRK